MNGFNGISTEALMKAAQGRGQKPSNGVRGFGDYNDATHIDAIHPATSMPLPPGPANFPITQGTPAVPATTNGLLQAILDVGNRILEELVRSNSSSTPVIRSKLADTTGVSLDWSQFGLFDRIMMRNAGPNIVYYAYDMNGQSVDTFTSDLSFMLLVNESVNLDRTKFRKIGLKCATGTAVVNATAWQTMAGNLNGSIS